MSNKVLKWVIGVVAVVIVVTTLSIVGFNFFISSQRLVLRCEITSDKNFYPKGNLLNSFSAKGEKEDIYFLINLKDKTVNSYSWEPLENYSEVELDENLIGIHYEDDKGSVENYAINRQTGEVLGNGKRERDDYSVFYHYSGKCEPEKLKKKF